MCNISQHIMEPILVDAIETAGVADLRFGHQLESFVQDEQGVSAVVREVQSGASYTIRADYLIGADGARSRIAQQLALPFEGHMGSGGDTGIGEVVYVWIKADLSRYCAHRPGTMYWATDPHHGATFVNVLPWDEWVAGWNLLPGEVYDPSPEALRRRVAAAIGDSTIDITIKSVSRWALNRMWATRYGEGRVWCMGDAVHRHPPMNGLGSNTSVADGYNLAWKLKLMLEGKAGPELLQSYEIERQPVGEYIVNRAWDSAVGFFGRFYPEFLGINPAATSEQVQQALLLLKEDSPEGEFRRASFEKFKHEVLDPAFNALGVEMGYRYRSGARVDDGTPEPVVYGHQDVAFEATTWPGARLPHAWLERGLRRISTLDLVGRGQFVLLTGRGGTDWFEAAREAERITGVRVEVCLIDTRFGTVRDPLGQWAQARGTRADGCVLVRPDGHVAWRAESVAAAGELSSVMTQVLGVPETKSVAHPSLEASELSLALHG
ncbi:FAD-dependent monooxygenase [Pseudomonas poae]|nr:FAD-dependent monooxygenase [Pseudomonas poae]